MLRPLQGDSVSSDSFDEQFLELRRCIRKEQSDNLASVCVLTDRDASRSASDGHKVSAMLMTT